MHEDEVALEAETMIPAQTSANSHGNCLARR
jgi:hypothetical protein